MPLELRVGVTDPDGVDTVIGSYGNKSESIWTNVTMHLDYSTNNPDDYAAEALTFMVSGGYFLAVWKIKFYANDSIGNWNVSEDKEVSVYRPNFGTTTYNSVMPLEFLVLGIIGILGILSICLIYRYLIYRKRRQ